MPSRAGSDSGNDWIVLGDALSLQATAAMTHGPPVSKNWGAVLTGSPAFNLGKIPMPSFMPSLASRFACSFAGLMIAAANVPPTHAAEKKGSIESRAAEVNGVKLHYLVAGKGDPVILLHGYAQNSHMWRPLIPELAKTHTVIAPDLRGFGASAKPESGYDKKRMAQDIHALAASLGFKRVGIAGHDIGLMVAYAYAAQYPDEVERIALLDAFLPGIGDTTGIFLLRDLWHFNSYGETPLKLVAGRERIYFEHFWNDFAADPKKSVSEADRRVYTKAYAQPGAMRAGFEVFHAFEQDGKDFARMAKTKLKMPMLVLTG